MLRTILKRVPNNPTCFMCMKTLSTSPSEVQSSDEKFTTIYRLPQIIGCSTVNKVKKFHLIASSSTLAITGAAYSAGFVDWDLVDIVLQFGVSTSVVLLAAGTLVTRLIGFLYVSEDMKKVKIGYIDFWGKRIDAVYKIDDFGPVLKTPPPLNKFYKIVDSSDSKYKISLNYGEILNHEVLSHLLECDIFEDSL